jgi:hypothetical protein
VGLVVLTYVLFKVQVFWDVTLSVGDYVLFVSFSGLRSPRLLNPEDECNETLRIVGKYSSNDRKQQYSFMAFHVNI